jgi:hypothetical protein
MRKPFDVFIEGVELANNRGHRTPLDLCVAGVRGLPVAIRGFLHQAVTR